MSDDLTKLDPDERSVVLAALAAHRRQRAAEEVEQEQRDAAAEGTRIIMRDTDATTLMAYGARRELDTTEGKGGTEGVGMFLNQTDAAIATALFGGVFGHVSTVPVTADRIFLSVPDWFKSMERLYTGDGPGLRRWNHILDADRVRAWRAGEDPRIP